MAGGYTDAMRDVNRARPAIGQLGEGGSVRQLPWPGETAQHSGNIGLGSGTPRCDPGHQTAGLVLDHLDPGIDPHIGAWVERSLTQASRRAAITGDNVVVVALLVRRFVEVPIAARDLRAIGVTFGCVQRTAIASSATGVSSSSVELL